MARSKQGYGALRARFAQEYPLDHNGTQAAIRAGYSEAAAGQIASRLLRHPEVKAAIEAAEAERTVKLGLTAEAVLGELKRIAFADPKAAYDEAGNLLPVHQMPEDLRRGIASLESEEGKDGAVLKKVRKWDKVKALELLAKHLGLLVDRQRIEGEGGGPVLVEVVNYAAEKKE